MAAGTKLPKGMYQMCRCRSGRTHCEQHPIWVGYKARGKQRHRASCDDLTGRTVRTLEDAKVVQRAFMAAIDNGTYVPKAKLRRDEPVFADGMDAFIEHRFVARGVIVVPVGARMRQPGESYLDWLYAALQARIERGDGNPDEIERAKVDRSRLSRPKLIVRRWGALKMSMLGIGHLRALNAFLLQPARLRPTASREELRAHSTVVGILRLAISVVDWCAQHGPTPEAPRFLRRSPFRDADNGKLMIEIEEAQDARTRRCPPEEEARLHAAARAHGYDWLSDLIVFAIDSMMRKNEVRRLRIRDLSRPGWIRVVGTLKRASGTQRAGSRVNKTNSDREVPITTARCKDVIDRWRMDASGRVKGPDEYVFCDGTGHRPRADWSYQWAVVKLRADGWVPAREATAGDKVLSLKGSKLSAENEAALDEIDLRWHDLRAEGISRLCDAGVPESHVGKMAGNPTEVARYNRRRDDAILASGLKMEAAALEVVKIMSKGSRNDEATRAA